MKQALFVFVWLGVILLTLDWFGREFTLLVSVVLTLYFIYQSVSEVKERFIFGVAGVLLGLIAAFQLQMIDMSNELKFKQERISDYRERVSNQRDRIYKLKSELKIVSSNLESAIGRCNVSDVPYFEVPDLSGPTALCQDGTYSYSQNRQGTCSWHGGVAKWLK